MHRTAGRGGTAPAAARRAALALALAGMAASVPVPSAGDALTSPEVTVTQSDLVQLVPGIWSAPRIFSVPSDPAQPAIPIYNTDAAKQLRQLIERGPSQGFGGLIYENRDGDHSGLGRDLFPAMTFLRYDSALKSRGLDRGLGGRVLVPGIVIGNASVAMKTPGYERSMVRLAMTAPDWPATAYRTYVLNKLYIYPEHADHDDIDLYPANWPYTITSQGSSASDQTFMFATLMTTAAFTPRTRAALEENGLIAPTLQMILRRNLAPVGSRADYLSGAAHPTVFDGRQVRLGRMLGHAVGMTPETIPPMVRLRIEREDFSRSAGLAGRDERLFTTPAAIARIWRAPDGRREMVLSAAETEDPNGRDLRFDWVLLRGDPARVEIEPLDAAGTRARIRIDWHDPWDLPVPEDGGTRRTSRVDIGVFAWNGAQDSAPAILSVSFPDHQRRRYKPGPDGEPQLVSIDYDALGREAYFDPVLHWSAPWTDSYAYDADGVVTGWTRRGSDGSEVRFDAAGRPMGTEVFPRYGIVEQGRGRPVLTPQP